jgi:hypothetical protein
MTLRIAALIVVGTCGIGSAYAQESSAPGPGLVEVTYMPAGAAFFTSKLHASRLMAQAPSVDPTALARSTLANKDAYRLCYIRGPGGLLIGLAQELS